MKALIFTGGNIQRDFALDFMKTYGADCVLAADRGVLFCYEEHIVPDCILGDFDSLPPEVFSYYRERADIPIRAFNPVKDATDTCIALEEALSRGCGEVVLLGATGTRLDHVVCNIQILIRAWERGVSAYIVDKNNRITIPVEKSFELGSGGQFGRYVSFFPMRGSVEGLTLTGFKYPLKDHRLTDRDGLGVSNELSAPCARVSWRDGILLMIQSRD